MRKQEMAPRGILLAAALFGVATCTRPSEIETPPAPPLVQPAKSENIPPIRPALREPPPPTPKAPESPEFRFSGKWIADFKLLKVDPRGQPIRDRDGRIQWEPALAKGTDGKTKQLTSEYFLPNPVIQGDGSEILFEVNHEGSKLLEEITKQNPGKTMGIFVDGNPTSTSIGQQTINKKSVIVVRAPTQNDALKLAKRLNAEAISRLIRIIPTRFEISDSIPEGINKGKTEGGWKWILIKIGFENVSQDPDDLAPIGLLREEQFINAKVLTKEGFQYGLYDTGNNDVYCSYNHLELPSSFSSESAKRIKEQRLPSGFRTQGIFWQGGLGGLDRRILVPQMCFKVAKNTSGYKLQIPGLSEIDLEKEAERVKNLRFPTDRPDSDFQEFIGRSFTIPNKGILRITGIEIVKDKFIARAHFTNASQGYDRAFYVPFQIFGNDGVLYGGGISGEVGPGLSKEVTGNLNIPRGVSGGKIVATGDIEGVFNLNLSSVQEAKPSILKAGYFERCTDCGASFKVDDLEISQEKSQEKLRIPITIQNTGESGKLEFDLNSPSNKVYIFDSTKAAKFKDAFRETNAFRTADLWPILFGSIHPLSFIISPEPKTRTPTILPVGKEWSGSFEAKSDSLPPKDKIAAVLVSLTYTSEKLRSAGRYEAAWVSYDDTRPFIEIKR